MIKNGKIWPIMIALAIFGVVLLSYWTIKQTAKADLTQSDMYMSSYQNVDDNINEIILKKIDFNKNYTISIENFDLTQNGFVSYKLVDKDGNSVNNAQLELVFSRPSNDAEDIKMKPSSVKDGVYIFSNIHLPKVGRWDLMLFVKVGDKERYYNVKTDTRSKKIKEY